MDSRTVMELNRLREENAKLKEELGAFDVEFFEEIEDLKYKYAEAVRKLKAYEGSRGDAHGASRSRSRY